MNEATVFCVPSVTAGSGDTEAFGMVFAEAQAMGLPVVSTTSGGIPEAVADGVTGFLVSERAAGPIAEKITLLLENREMWHQFSVAGMKRVRERFDLRRQCLKLEQLYRDVLTGSRSGHGPDLRVSSSAGYQGSEIAGTAV
jgi:glycosyltransferase involved in cell wall biosynthesis